MQLICEWVFSLYNQISTGGIGFSKNIQSTFKWFNISWNHANNREPNKRHCTQILKNIFFWKNPLISEIYILDSSTTWDRSNTHPKFDPTGVWTHDIQIKTVHYMSLRCMLSAISDLAMKFLVNYGDDMEWHMQWMGMKTHTNEAHFTDLFQCAVKPIWTWPHVFEDYLC